MTVAKPHPHDAARLHVTGAARYVDDIPTPRGTLHLAFGLSGIACGRVTGMDLARVRESAGVVAVLTADDLPHGADCSPSAMTSRCFAPARCSTTASRCFWSSPRATLPPAARRVGLRWPMRRPRRS